ncbi:MAG: IDEAL domain-containing protein [Bacillota bacterium]|jgi:hypothetical protein
MTSNNQHILKTGDWVKGKSRDGELIVGYIESLDITKGVVKVTVVSSDNNETIGKTISILNKQIKRMPDSTVTNKEQIRFLIDLALSTGDEDWFIELSSKLNSMKQLVNGVC